MRTLTAVLLSTLIVVIAVGCGGSGSSGPLVTVSPASLTVETGGDAVTFQADLSNGATGPVSWTLDPATGLGTLSSATGLQTVYTPPPLGGSPGTLKVRAQASGNVGYTATVTVNASTTGGLTITVTGQPPATAASIHVTGPGGFSQTVSTQATATLSKLAPGSYTLTPAEITSTGNMVDSKYAAPPVTATVTANAGTTSTVTYESEPGYGRLWLSLGTADALAGFTESEFFVDRAPSATPGTSGAVQGIAFDASGAMWASLKAGSDSVVRYAAADLETGSTTPPMTPTLSITSGISDPGGVAFGNGLLWVANCGGSSLTAYPTTGGSAQITLTGSVLNCPRGIAFDKDGNLWVANSSGSAVRLLKTAIASSANNVNTADLTLTAPGATAPTGVALDKDGNVWVAFCGGSKLARYTPPALDAGVVLSAAGSPPSIDCPVAAALDNSGRLWASNQSSGPGQGTVVVFDASVITTTGTPTPASQLTGLNIRVGGLAFNPTPANLPINH